MEKLLIAALVFMSCTLPLSQANGQAQMGAPADGEHYSVIKTTTITKAAPEFCGFNDPGLPHMGIFRQETRAYTEYKHGKLQRQWTATVDVFVRCHEP
jgi:hypothetical protein